MDMHQGQSAEAKPELSRLNYLEQMDAKSIVATAML